MGWAGLAGLGKLSLGMSTGVGAAIGAAFHPSAALVPFHGPRVEPGLPDPICVGDHGLYPCRREWGGHQGATSTDDINIMVTTRPPLTLPSSKELPATLS